MAFAMGGGGLMGGGGFGGNNPEYLQQLLNAQRNGVPFSNTDSYLQQVAAQPTSAPQSNAPVERPGQPVTPGPSISTFGPTSGGGGGVGGGGGQGGPMGYDAYLQQLQSRVNSYDPTAGINDAYDQMRRYVGQQTVNDATAQMGSRGLLPSDNTSQDLKAVLMGRAMAPVASQHAMALANAQQQGLSNQMTLAGMLGDAQRAQQQQQWQQQQFEYQKSQDAATRAFQQSQMDNSNRQWQTQFDWNRQQEQNRNIAGGVTDPSGNPIAPGSGQPAAPGSSYDPAAAARALILGGSGGRTLADVLGQGGGGGAPMTSTGQQMGGGTGLAGGAANPGSGFGEKYGGFTGGHVWDGVDRSVGYNKQPPNGEQAGGNTPFAGFSAGGMNDFASRGLGSGLSGQRPFEGPGTSTVGTSQRGPTTTGSGTTVGSGSPFSGGMNGGGGTVASTPFPGVQGSGTYTTISPKPPAPAPRRFA